MNKRYYFYTKENFYRFYLEQMLSTFVDKYVDKLVFYFL